MGDWIPPEALATGRAAAETAVATLGGAADRLVAQLDAATAGHADLILLAALAATTLLWLSAWRGKARVEARLPSALADYARRRAEEERVRRSPRALLEAAGIAVPAAAAVKTAHARDPEDEAYLADGGTPPAETGGGTASAAAPGTPPPGIVLVAEGTDGAAGEETSDLRADGVDTPLPVRVEVPGLDGTLDIRPADAREAEGLSAAWLGDFADRRDAGAPAPAGPERPHAVAAE